MRGAVDAARRRCPAHRTPRRPHALSVARPPGDTCRASWAQLADLYSTRCPDRAAGQKNPRIAIRLRPADRPWHVPNRR